MLRKNSVVGLGQMVEVQYPVGMGEVGRLRCKVVGLVLEVVEGEYQRAQIVATVGDGQDWWVGRSEQELVGDSEVVELREI